MLPDRPATFRQPANTHETGCQPRGKPSCDPESELNAHELFRSGQPGTFHTMLERRNQALARSSEKQPTDTNTQGLSAAKDAVRMARIAKFYERLPKGPAPEIKPSGLLGRYQAKYFGKEPSAARKCLLR